MPVENQLPLSASARQSTSWSRFKIPAVLLLISLNVLYFAGNAALDLAQIAAPTRSFAGSVSMHDQQLQTSGETSQQLYILGVDTGHGVLTFDVPDHTFDATKPGDTVSGTLDGFGLLGHDEGLRSLKDNGAPVFDSLAYNRAINAAVILVVVLSVGVLALRWVQVTHRRVVARQAELRSGAAVEA